MSDFQRLVRKVGNVTFPYPVMLAGGIVKTAEQARKLVGTDVIPEWGSFTTDGGSGNGGRDYHAEYHTCPDGQRFLQYTQNSLGLPNPGMEHAEKYGPELIARYRDRGKPLVINVSGDGVDDLLSLVKRAVACEFPVITANAACPNKADNQSRPLPILCYDTESVDRFFDRAEQEIGKTDQVLLWKVSAGMPRPVLEHNRRRVAKSSAFSGMITCNTVPNTLDYGEDGRTTILTDKNKITRGGMGGPAILPIALDHTEFCALGMPQEKVVFGCGGAGDVKGVLKFFRAGATMVQIHSAYREAGEDPEFITHILIELLAILA